MFAAINTLLLLLDHSLALAPGDVDETCREQGYPANVKVLLDSWRYQTLLAGKWTATNTDAANRQTVSTEYIAVLLAFSVLVFLYPCSGILKVGSVKLHQ